MPPEQLEVVLAAKLQTLKVNLQQQFDRLCNGFDTDYPLSGIFNSNSLPLGFNAPIGGVYKSISRINHSCLPNCHASWNSNTEQETVYAIRMIKPGEDLTIAYDRGGTRETRRAFLKATYGFDCECNLCSRRDSDVVPSDSRRVVIQSLDASLGSDFLSADRPEASLRDCRLLLRALEEEYEGCYGELSAKVYFVAYQVNVSHGDLARAGVFAGRSYNARILSEDETTPETQLIKALAENPANHPSYGSRSWKWYTTMDMIPDTADLLRNENWLFRVEE
jgi:hypothetical protein